MENTFVLSQNVKLSFAQDFPIKAKLADCVKLINLIAKFHILS